jgi:hypothetical protein
VNAPFFITGLPRSRTAWLANYFTNGDVFCYHDAFKDTVSVDKLAKLLDRGEQVRYFGDSDSGLLLHAAELKKRFPKSPWLFVRRDVRDAERSFEEYFSKVPYPGAPRDSAQLWRAFQLCENAYAEAKAAIGDNGIEVDFESLNDWNLIETITRFLVPGAAFDFSEERFRLLNTFRVNIIPEKLTFCEEYLQLTKGV